MKTTMVLSVPILFFLAAIGLGFQHHPAESQRLKPASEWPHCVFASTHGTKQPFNYRICQIKPMVYAEATIQLTFFTDTPVLRSIEFRDANRDIGRVWTGFAGTAEPRVTEDDVTYTLSKLFSHAEVPPVYDDHLDLKVIATSLDGRVSKVEDFRYELQH